MHRYSGNVPNGLHIPYLAEQLLFGKHMVRVLGKEGQKVKFLCGKGFLLPVDPHAPGCLINFQAADFNQLIGRLPAANKALIPGHVRLHPGHHLAWAEWLGDIIVCSQSQTADFVNILFFGRNHNDGRVLYFPYSLTYLKSICTGQHQIQNQKIIVFLQRLIQTGTSIIFNLYLKAGQLQIILL